MQPRQFPLLQLVTKLTLPVLLFVAYGRSAKFIRSLNLEQEAQGKQQEKDKDRSSLSGISTASSAENSKLDPDSPVFSRSHRTGFFTFVRLLLSGLFFHSFPFCARIASGCKEYRELDAMQSEYAK